ncbi:MAG: hypothetical protein WBQ76_13360 [Candidatus Korobacteraceae bacterium]
MKIFMLAAVILLMGTLAAQDTPATNTQRPQPLSPSFVKAAKRAKKAIDSNYCQTPVCQETQKYIDDASVEASTKAEQVTMTIIETYSLKISLMNQLARNAALAAEKFGGNGDAVLASNPQYQQLRAETNRCSQAIDETLKSATFDPSITCK